jgi:hypothetical protein
MEFHISWQGTNRGSAGRFINWPKGQNFSTEAEGTTSMPL